jgi:hypothetical protein
MSDIKPPGIKRDDYKTRLAAMTDEELTAESKVAIELHRRSFGYSKWPSRTRTELCWYECLERKKPELYQKALDLVKAELGEKP